jgi:hypothetical protein
MTAALRLHQRLFALLGLLSLLCAVLLQGRPYIRCTLDGTLHFATCCQAAHWDDGRAFDDASCCEQIERADLAPAAPSSPSPPLPSPDAAPPLPPAFPALLALAAPPPAPLPERPPARAGPPPPPTARRLARLARLLS